MHRSRNIIKRFVLSRCPPPAFGGVPIRDSIANGYSHAQANLAASCRKLYTKLLESGRDHLVDIRGALISRRRDNDMTWVKLTCNLTKNIKKKPKSVVDYLSMPLRDCFDFKPCRIGYRKRILCSECIGSNTGDRELNIGAQITSPPIQLEPQSDNTSEEFRNERVRFQSLRVTPRNPLKS